MGQKYHFSEDGEHTACGRKVDSRTLLTKSANKLNCPFCRKAIGVRNEYDIKPVDLEFE